ncbi:MAG: hypothetical protein WCS85_00460 [Candidatus Peribacteraceae bacterium]
MPLLRAIVGIVRIPVAHASLSSALSSQENGVGKMWEVFMGLFPFGDESGTGFVSGMLGSVQMIILGGISATGVALLAYAGARLAMTGWNEEGITKAKSIVKNVVIGLIGALLADAIIVYALSFLMTIFK